MRTPSALYKCTVCKQSAKEITRQRTEWRFWNKTTKRLKSHSSERGHIESSSWWPARPLKSLWSSQTALLFFSVLRLHYQLSHWPFLSLPSFTHKPGLSMWSGEARLTWEPVGLNFLQIKTWSARENTQAEQSKQRAHTHPPTHTQSHVHCVSVAQRGHIEAFTIIPHSL